MNTFAIVFSAIIVVAAAGVSRNTGWGSPAAPQIDLELQGALAAQGSGAASADQQIVESASGDAHNPAYIISSSGIFAGVAQEGEIAQVATANLPSGNTATLQGVSVDQQVLAVDSLIADIGGANSAYVADSAATSASGEGSVVAEASSLNDVNRPEH